VGIVTYFFVFVRFGFRRVLERQVGGFFVFSPSVGRARIYDGCVTVNCVNNHLADKHGRGILRFPSSEGLNATIFVVRGTL
jgi:hypothetical protein